MMTTPSPFVAYNYLMRWVVRVWKPLLIAAYALSFSCANLAFSASPKPVALSVSPGVGYAPLTVRARITIPPHDDNRYFCLVYDNGSTYGSSDCRNHGPYDSLSTWVDIKNLPEGEYIIFVELHRANDYVLTTPQQRLKVLAAFPQ